jgi:hypothetical protein
MKQEFFNILQGKIHGSLAFVVPKTFLPMMHQLASESDSTNACMQLPSSHRAMQGFETCTPISSVLCTNYLTKPCNCIKVMMKELESGNFESQVLRAPRELLPGGEKLTELGVLIAGRSGLMPGSNQEDLFMHRYAAVFCLVGKIPLLVVPANGGDGLQVTQADGTLRSITRGAQILSSNSTYWLNDSKYELCISFNSPGAR